jgi:hypothetical protein
MRLLSVDSLTFQEFSDSLNALLPPYATASHRWIAGTEVFLKEVVQRGGPHQLEDGYDAQYRCKLGWRKISGFVAFMRKHLPSIKWLWIDTCCIDKESSLEVATAIRSMFRWYMKAEVCLAYLDDVPAADDLVAFDKSVWFQRGWTLQELLAPTTVVFLTLDWQIIGHKGRSGYGRNGVSMHTGRPLGSRISAITKIPENILENYDAAKHVALDEKMTWIQNRKTSLDEDKWYCMLGILGALGMDIHYGVGEQDTYERLLRNLAEQGRWRRQASGSSTATNVLPLTHAGNRRVEGDDMENEVQRVIYSEPVQATNPERATRATNQYQGLRTSDHDFATQGNRGFQNIRDQNTILQNSQAIPQITSHRGDKINISIPERVQVDVENVLQELYNFVQDLLVAYQSTDQHDEDENVTNDQSSGDNRRNEPNNLPGTRVGSEETTEPLADQILQPEVSRDTNASSLHQDALDDLNFHLHSLETFWDDKTITERVNEMRLMIRKLELHPDADLDCTWRTIELATRTICRSLPPTYSLFRGGLNNARAELNQTQSQRIRPKFFGLYLEYREPYPDLYSLDEEHYQEKPVTLIFLSIDHKESKQTIREWLEAENFHYVEKDSGSKFVISNIIVVDKLRKGLCGIKVTIKVIYKEKDFDKLTTSSDEAQAFWILCFKTTDMHAFARSCGVVSCISNIASSVMTRR